LPISPCVLTLTLVTDKSNTMLLPIQVKKNLPSIITYHHSDSFRIFLPFGFWGEDCSLLRRLVALEFFGSLSDSPAGSRNCSNHTSAPMRLTTNDTTYSGSHMDLVTYLNCQHAKECWWRCQCSPVEWVSLTATSAAILKRTIYVNTQVSGLSAIQKSFLDLLNGLLFVFAAVSFDLVLAWLTGWNLCWVMQVRNKHISMWWKFMASPSSFSVSAQCCFPSGAWLSCTCLDMEGSGTFEVCSILGLIYMLIV